MSGVSEYGNDVARRALTVLERGYLEQRITATELRAALEALGVRNILEVDAIVSALNVLTQWGEPAPLAAGAGASEGSYAAWPGAWPRGKHVGRGLSETPAEYLEDYAATGQNPLWREACANELSLRAAGVA
jgi:hypothetical protein